MEDPEILLMLNNRDENAVAALFDKYGGLCRSIIANILSDPRDAEECLNGVMFRLWSSIPPASPNDLKAYTAKAARNEALMKARSLKTKEAFETPLTELELFLPAPDGGNAGELTEIISRFLKEQAPLKRNVFIRRYWYFDGIGEIAKRYSVSESKVASLLFRMRNKLYGCLEKEGYFNGKR